MSKRDTLQKIFDIGTYVAGAYFVGIAIAGAVKRKREQKAQAQQQQHPAVTTGVGAVSTRDLEDKMWGFSSVGRGQIMYRVDFRGQTHTIFSNNTIAYDRIKEHDYGEIDDRQQNENFLTYRQALMSLWADAMEQIA